MKKSEYFKASSALCLTSILLILSIRISSSQELCTQPGTERIAGEQDGYRYELWNQNAQGTACMTLGRGALFSGEWEGIQNYLARRGLGYDQTLEHEEIGTFYTSYNCDYNASTESGNSYLSVYGWTVEPLKEYYIVEDWRNWIPSMAEGTVPKGTITVNGGIYDIYESTRVNQPSIIGITTFQQYFSIRRTVRNSGTINISEHFLKWESLGMEMGKMYEVSFVVEGYQSSGSFDFTALEVLVSNDPAASAGTLKEPSPLLFYPNPDAGIVLIELGESALNANIRIYTISGTLIFSQESIHTNLLQVSDLKSGIYFVNVCSNRLNYTSRFLI
jgi:endo-1,4-beta-xylanase